MNQYIKNYLESVDEDARQRKEIDEIIYKKEQSISRLRKQIVNLENKKNKITYPSWTDSILNPIAEEIARRLDLRYEVSGVFGLRAECYIFFYNKSDNSVKYSLTITPQDLKEGILHYDTGKLKNEYLRGCQDLNGLNKETAPLPESIDDILKIIEEKEKK